jgi:predicted nucleic acid-binding protein
VFRRVLASDPLHGVVRTALDTLILRGELVYITAQNLVEFRALATRPAAANRLGMTPAQASIEAQQIEALFPLAQELPAIYPLWRTLVDTHDVVGRQVFDARLVAVMQAHGLTHLLTLNSAHFQRFSGITVVDPHTIQ